MGDVADSMMDGTLCATCGAYVGEPVGFPQYCAACDDSELDSVCEQCGDPAEYDDELILCVPCRRAADGIDDDDRSVNCYFCSKLVDERECQPAHPYNNGDGGSICPACLKKKTEPKEMEFMLHDTSGEDGTDPVKAKLQFGGEGLEIFLDGYGTKLMKPGNGSPIFLELYEGQLMLHVWADINQEDATHRICLGAAHEAARHEEDG